MLVYIEFISRRPGVSTELFHEVTSKGQHDWMDAYPEDELVLSLGRNWRAGPEPEYLAVWFSPNAGLERLEEWERAFGGKSESYEDAFRLVARIDRAGFYEPLLQPVAGSGGRYYAEYFDFDETVSRGEVRSFYERRLAERPAVVLNLLVDRIGYLGPEPRGLAVWSLPAYADLHGLIADLDDGPITMVAAALYADAGKEVL